MRKITALLFIVVLTSLTACTSAMPTPTTLAPTSANSTPSLTTTVQRTAPKPSTLVPAPTPTPPESISPEDRAISYNLVPQAELLTLGKNLPTDPTSQEQDKVIQIALGIQPIKDLLAQGLTYRPQALWMSYQNGSWSEYAGKPQVTQAAPNTVYFPGVRIGLGSPQRYAFSVAVDLASSQAVYAIRRPDKRVPAPSYVHYLTDAEKANLFAIAGVNPNMTPAPNLQWAAISKGGSFVALDYNIVDAGIPDYNARFIQENAMTIYPSLVMNDGNSITVLVIDLQSGKVVFSDHYPLRRGPVPAPPK